MADLISLRNIGRNIERRLKAVDISTAEELKRVGSKEAFIRLKSHDPSVCVTYLYTLEGAVSDIEYNDLPEDVKKDLKNFSNGLI